VCVGWESHTRMGFYPGLRYEANRTQIEQCLSLFSGCLHDPLMEDHRMLEVWFEHVREKDGVLYFRKCK